jgi:hypothetical protein
MFSRKMRFSAGEEMEPIPKLLKAARDEGPHSSITVIVTAALRDAMPLP